jgi:hypothetical protein
MNVIKGPEVVYLITFEVVYLITFLGGCLSDYFPWLSI